MTRRNANTPDDPNHKPWDPRKPKAKKQPTRKDAPSRSPDKPYNKRWKKGEVRPDPVTPENRKNKNTDICGAKRSGKSHAGPGICCQPAGWGTSHLGFGPCKFHGGNLPGHVKHAEKQMAAKACATFGLPVEVDPHQALMQEIWRTNGHVLWLGELIANMEDESTLKQYSEAGVQPSVWITMYEAERAHLVKVAAEAIKCGVAERQIQLAEEQGRLMAMVMQAFIRDPELNLTPAQLAFAPKILRKHITAVPSALEQAVANDQETVIDV